MEEIFAVASRKSNSIHEFLHLISHYSVALVHSPNNDTKYNIEEVNENEIIIQFENELKSNDLWN